MIKDISIPWYIRPTDASLPILVCHACKYNKVNLLHQLIAFAPEVCNNMRRIPAVWPELLMNAFVAAAEYGYIDILNTLARPPFSITTRDINRFAPNVIWFTVCGKGSIKVLDRLALPPFNMSKVNAQYNDNSALKYAITHNRYDIVNRLARQPYLLNKGDVAFVVGLQRMRGDDILTRCSAKMRRRLEQPPYKTYS
jgi:hypothetical protein